MVSRVRQVQEVAIDGAARATVGPMVQAGRQGSSKRPKRPMKTRRRESGQVRGNGGSGCEAEKQKGSIVGT